MLTSGKDEPSISNREITPREKNQGTQTKIPDSQETACLFSSGIK
jgi:hypothetical protein